MPRQLVADKRISTSLSLSKEALRIIDDHRGQLSRSAFVDDWLICAFGGKVAK
jgi:hypothetical protein